MCWCASTVPLGCVGILLGILGVLGFLHLLPFNLQGVRIGPQLRVG